MQPPGPYQQPYSPYGPTPYQAPPPKKSSNTIWIVLACVVAGSCAAVGGTCAYTMRSTGKNDSPQGVVIGIAIPEKAVAALRTAKVINPEERVLAYWDSTLSLDQSELGLVTNEAIIQRQDGRVDRVPYADVVSARFAEDAPLTQSLTVVAKDAHSMRIEIAVLNSGDAFCDAFEGAWKITNPSASVVRVKK